MRKLAWRILAGVVGLALAGCVQATAAPTPFVTPEPTATDTPYRGLCAYVWADQVLAQAGDHLNQALQRSGMGEAEGSVSSYGETCVDSGTNVVVSFTPEETSYSLVVRVDNASDGRVLGDWLGRLIPFIEEFHTNEGLGGRIGRMDVQFQDISRSVVVSFPLVHGRELIDSGVRGSALFDQLSRE